MKIWLNHTHCDYFEIETGVTNFFTEKLQYIPNRVIPWSDSFQVLTQDQQISEWM